MGYIYIVENRINSKKYIGQTIQNDINKRWKQHKSSRKIGKILHNAYQKYGIENFKFKILCVCFDCDVNQYEIDYIKKYDTIYPNGYNLLEGGKNGKHNQHTIDILKQKLSGPNHPNYGKKFTNERKVEMSISRIGALNANYGKNMAHEQKEKIRNTMKSFDQNKRETINQKIREKLKNYTKNSKSISQHDLSGTFIKEYESISQASRELSISRSSIQRCCDGKYKTARNFIWKYI